MTRLISSKKISRAKIRVFLYKFLILYLHTAGEGNTDDVDTPRLVEILAYSMCVLCGLVIVHVVSDSMCIANVRVKIQVTTNHIPCYDDQFILGSLKNKSPLPNLKTKSSSKG